MSVSTLPWYVARSSGLMAWALVTASVVWGLLISTRASVRGRKPRPAWTLDLHRYLGGLATVFTAIHVGGIVADSYVHFGWLALLVPFASSWRTVAVAWGVVGMYLLAAVELTSLLRAKLSRKAWRAVHFASFPLFITASTHAIAAGSDTGTWVFQSVLVASIVAIAGLTGLRIQQATSPAPERPRISRVAA